MEATPTDRRTFLKTTTLAAAGATVVPRHVLGGPGYQPPSDTLNLAGIGVGGRGISNMSALTSENIVAICDVDFRRVDQSLRDENGNVRDEYEALHAAYEQADRYADFRRMLDEVGDDIDAVVISTPDHVHAVAAKQAMERGKHVYVEKPLTRTVYEARVLRETADRTNAITQMGNQGHTHADGRRLLEWVWADAIGPVSEVHVWTDRPAGWWPQGVDRPDEPQPVPEHLDWELFLGPVPPVSYHEAYHPFRWRGWVDFGTGALGDMGAHLIDHAYWALDLDYPTQVWSSSTAFGGEGDTQASWPLATTTHYEFAPGGREPVRMTWYDGGLLPPRPEALPREVSLNRGGGCILVGEEGILVYDTYGHNPRLYPEELETKYSTVPKQLPRIDVSHQMNWAQACKEQAEATCPFEYAVPMIETMLLGLVSLRARTPIEYDPRTMTIPNAPDAEQYLRPTYREEWSL